VATTARQKGRKDLTKLKELILLVASKSEHDPRFGAVKLNKLLYYMDMRAYRELGQPISAATYQRLREGPAPVEMLPALRELKASGDIEEQVRNYHDHTQMRVVPKREPDTELFTPEERAIVEQVIEELFYMNGRQVSLHSHEEWGWKLAKDGDVIPYGAAWLAAGPLTQEQELAGTELWHEIAGERG
jgi:uncharacterized phage-associated protein